MSLPFQYGINTGNRFGQLLDHDEDPDEFIANQTQTEEKTKKSKDTKTASASTKKSTTKSTTSATTTSTTTTGATTKSNKENVTGKTSGNEQRKQQNVAFSDNQQQNSGRPESGRGAGRGGAYPRRGGSAGPDRGGRGSANPRYNRTEGQQTGGFEQGPDSWTGESGNDNQQFSGSRGRGGRGRGRGNYEGGRGNYEGGRGNYEGGRGFGRGRGGRGRGFNNANRQFTDSSQGQEQETSNWEQSAGSNFDNRAQNTATDSEIPISPQGQSFDADQPASRGGRGHFRSRTFRSNRNQGERSYHHERGENEQQGGQDEYRQNRRAHDRQPRNFVSTVKPIEKKDGQGAHNWGDQTEVPEEEPVVTDEAAEGTAAPATGSTAKDWSQRVDEEEQRLITFDEYKKQIEEKKKLTQEKLPQLKRRTAGEGEDPKAWKPPEQVYRKKNEDDGSDEEEEEGEAEQEEVESEEETDEQSVGKKKLIQIPLFFKPIETPRGGSGGRGGRRGGPRPQAERSAPPRDEQGQAPQQQTAPSSSQTTGDEERPQSGYRGGRGAGGSRGAGRGEYRRSYGNAARGSRGGHYSSAGKSGDSTSKFDFGNTDEFPTLAK